MRMIDADALKENLKLPEESGRMGELLGMVIDAVIDDAPTIEERKTGKWNCGDDMFEYAVCSNCKWDSGEAWEYALKNFRFCPNCGARMWE